MNRGIILKTIRETWATTAIFGLALAGFQGLVAYVFPTLIAEHSEQLLQVTFIRKIIEGLLGAEIGGMIGPQLLTSMPWVHPITLTLLWAHEVTLCTQTPAGEVDRGTIDMLLSLPVSRTSVYVSASVVWLGSGLAVVMMALVGNLIGSRLAAPEFRTAAGPMMIVIVNMFCLYFAVGGVSLLVSTLSDHRGKAVGVIFAILLVSFLLNFLAQFWSPAKEISFLSVMHYYRPPVVMQDPSWPVTDLLVLAVAGVGFWLAGAVVFARRDICTT